MALNCKIQYTKVHLISNVVFLKEMVRVSKYYIIFGKRNEMPSTEIVGFFSFFIPFPSPSLPLPFPLCLCLCLPLPLLPLQENRYFSALTRSKTPRIKKALKNQTTYDA